MHHFALVVTWTLPEDVDPATADAAFQAVLAEVRGADLSPAENFTAYSGVSAEVIDQAARVGQVVDQAERLHLEPGDRVVVTIKPDQVDSDDDLQRWTDIAREAFPDREIVVAREGTTITAQHSDAGEPA